MNCCHLRLVIVLLLVTGAETLRAQDELEKQLAAMEMRLQEQRAGTLRSRLVLYTDELEKLGARPEAKGDGAGRGAVTEELAAVRLAVKRLSAPALERFPDEKVQDSEAGNAAKIMARRIDAVIARFGEAKAASPGPARPQPAAAARARLLKIEKATLSSGSGALAGRDFWMSASSSVLWTINDLPPGDYEVILRYNIGQKGGGKAVIKAADQKLEKEIPAGESKEKKLEINAGILNVKEQGIDLRVENGGLAAGAEYLWDLRAVSLQPLGSPASKLEKSP